MKRIAVIFGTRPEVIKLSPLINDQQNDYYELVLISTGQQDDLNEKALKDFQIEPKVSLGLMKPNQTLNSYLSSAIAALEKALLTEAIDFTMVHGDTGTALAGALASYNLKIPVFHVEAGLRSYDLENPYPEEMNRKLISQLATLHFSPTDVATQNLIHEGISRSQIHQVGNTIVDVVHTVLKKYEHQLESNEISNHFEKYSRNILFTVHRRENHKNLSTLTSALEELALRHRDVGMWIPVHPNPNVRNHLMTLKGKYPNLHLMEPLEYLDFMSAMMHCSLLVTDSGGVQEEATVLGKYCLVLRETTERPELIRDGFGELVKFEKEEIIQKISDRLVLSSHNVGAASPFGDGKALERIRLVLREVASA